MATYVAPRAAAGVQPHDFKPGSNWLTSTFNIATAADSTLGGGAGGVAFALNDVIQMVKVPKGARVFELILTVTDLDTSTGIVIDVGDGDDPDRYIDGTTIGQTGGTVRLGSGIVNNSPAYTYTADDTIDILIQVAATGTAATTGTLTLAVGYTTDL